jgi:hypothetical protein
MAPLHDVRNVMILASTSFRLKAPPRNAEPEPVT